MSLPNLIRVKQQFDRTRLDDAPGAVTAGLQAFGLRNKMKPGARIAITAGSRGIQNLIPMTRAAVDWVKSVEGQPFIVPAMGSHGGATDEGQKSLLADLGISEASMGCPVVSSVQVEEIGRTPSGHPVFFSRDALHADGVIAINRVKLHTIFRGDVESGLCKILAVGLGKHKGGHPDPQDRRPALPRRDRPGSSWPRLPSWRAWPCWEKLPRRDHGDPGGAGRGLRGHRHRAPEAGLAALPRASPSTRWTPSSWTRWARTSAGPGWTRTSSGAGGRVGGKLMMGSPFVSSVVVLGLTPETHGNANGIGLADLTTRRLVDSIDYKSTYTNVITTRLWAGGAAAADPGDRPRGHRAGRRRDAPR